MRKSRGIETSETMTEEPRLESACRGRRREAPQYDYVCFEKRTCYRIPLEAGRKARGTEDDLHYLEISLRHPLVALDNWDVCGSIGLPWITQALGAPRMVLVEYISRSIPNPTNSPLHLLTPTSGIDFQICTYIQKWYQHFKSGIIFTCHGHKES